MKTETTTYVMPDGRPAPSLMTAEEACEFLRLDVETHDAANRVYRLRWKYNMPAVRVGGRLRFQPEKLAKWVESRSD